MNDIAVIAIGRNEGERLRLCLMSALASGCRVVYVDSKSTDGSVEMARSMGAGVVGVSQVTVPSAPMSPTTTGPSSTTAATRFVPLGSRASVTDSNATGAVVPGGAEACTKFAPASIETYRFKGGADRA